MSRVAYLTSIYYLHAEGSTVIKLADTMPSKAATIQTVAGFYTKVWLLNCIMFMS
jgi:hypothetical protein